jgi:molybdenum cofactor cytidylyltransferase
MSLSPVSAIVLAAGESRRMGENKLLLPWRGRTVIESIILTLRKCALSEIIVVLGHQVNRVRQALEGQPVRCILNEEFTAGMLSSVQCGVRESNTNTKGFLICLGDQPALNEEIIEPLLDALSKSKASIVLPSYRGARGHPLLISSQYRDEIFKLDPAVGLRQLRLRHADEVLIIEIPDKAVMQDLDYPEDYRRALEA